MALSPVRGRVREWDDPVVGAVPGSPTPAERRLSTRARNEGADALLAVRGRTRGWDDPVVGAVPGSPTPEERRPSTRARWGEEARSRLETARGEGAQGAPWRR